MTADVTAEVMGGVAVRVATVVMAGGVNRQTGDGRRRILIEVNGPERRRGTGMGEKSEVIGCEKCGWCSYILGTTSAAGDAEGVEAKKGRNC